MTARTSPFVLARPAEPVTDVNVARAHIAAQALDDGPVGHVGLELELHLVDLTLPARRPTWAQVQRRVAELPSMPCGSRVSAEPGGQLELSTRPAASPAAAVAALRTDLRALRAGLRRHSYGGAAMGTDPARPVHVINRTGRYGAMHRHFAAIGCAGPGRAMMASTAALQVNLDAGPARGWQERIAHLHRIGPVLAAISACSPMLARHASGWRSMRQQAWAGIDAGRIARIPGGDPAQAWADYALAAPVMLVCDDEGGAEPVPSRVSFASWITGDAKLIRRPTLRDLDYHLTTLFPPVRPRRWIELRYLDAVPQRWWPALAAITVALADDPVAAATADDACEPVADAWHRAARDALGDPALWRAARACLATAANRVPAELRDDAGAYAALVERRRTPGDEVRERIEADGPLAVLEEDARDG